MDIKERVAAIKAACLIDRPIGYEALKTSKEQTKTSTFKLELVHVRANFVLRSYTIHDNVELFEVSPTYSSQS